MRADFASVGFTLLMRDGKKRPSAIRWPSLPCLCHPPRPAPMAFHSTKLTSRATKRKDKRNFSLPKLGEDVPASTIAENRIDDRNIRREP
jgi:hypothetical protein